MVVLHAPKLSRWRVRAALVAFSLVSALAPTALAANPNFTISGFTPSQTTVGSSVTISGSNLSAINSIVFPNGAATFPISASSGTVVAIVPVDASGAGKLTLSNGTKTQSTSSSFSVKPTISSISPTSGAAYSTVITITGTGLSTLTGIAFTGTAASDFGVNSNQSAWATAPDLSAKPYKRSTLTVTTPGGSATSSQTFSQTSIGSSAAVFTASEVQTGYLHACARKSDGTVWCWGENGDGQLGDGTDVDSLHPVQVLASGFQGGTGADVPVPLTGVSQMVTDSVSSCALLSIGEVRCWGANGLGNLGDGTTFTRPNPVAVLSSGTASLDPVPLTDVVAISAGDGHVCAVKSDRTVVCWGWNDSGQLGDGTKVSADHPVAVVGVGGTGSLGGVASVSAGRTHTCAVLMIGQAVCWGANASGELGDGTQVQRSSPVRVVASGGGSFDGVTQIAVIGDEATCARRSVGSGSVWCWGKNDYGQLGIGSTTGSLSPVQVITGDNSPLSLATDLSAGYYFACVARSDGSAWCWGENGLAQLGDGTQENGRTVASPVLASGTPASNPIPLTGVVRLGIGMYADTSCAILAGGGSNVRCWGYNLRGQTGDGVVDDSVRPNPVPVRPRPYLTAVAVTGVGNGNCALRAIGGSVYCWGDNGDGQLGDGTTVSESRPVATLWSGSAQFSDVRLTGVVELVGGVTHVCARRSDGRVLCWGDNQYGQVGDGTTLDAVNPSAVVGAATGLLGGVVGLAASGSHTCALRSDGTVWCWGDNAYGQLGVPLTTNASSRPVQVSGPGGTGFLTGVVAIAAGGGANNGTATTCAIRKSGGTVWCWGGNQAGELGAGDLGTGSGCIGLSSCSAFPVQVKGVGGTGSLGSVASVAVDGGWACAVRKVGSVACWGDASDGQLGVHPDSVATCPGRFFGFFPCTTSPVLVRGFGGSGTLSGVVEVSAMYRTACARLSNGTMACWGSGYYGDLSDGTTGSDGGDGELQWTRSFPALVLRSGTVAGSDAVVLTGVTSLARTAWTPCAVVGGIVMCWGYDDTSASAIGDGQLVGEDCDSNPCRLHPFPTFGTYDPWS